MKYSKSALGLLKSQYFSVLKKCALINAGLFVLTAPAAAVEIPITDSTGLTNALTNGGEYTVSADSLTSVSSNLTANGETTITGTGSNSLGFDAKLTINSGKKVGIDKFGSLTTNKIENSGTLNANNVGTLNVSNTITNKGSLVISGTEEAKTKINFGGNQIKNTGGGYC